MADPRGGNVRNRKANNSRAGGAKPAVVEEVDTDEAEEIERGREAKERRRKSAARGASAPHGSASTTRTTTAPGSTCCAF